MKRLPGSEEFSELRRMLAAEPNLSKVMTHFLDRFVSVPHFMSMGHARKPPLELQKVVANAIGQALGKEAELVEWRLIDIPASGIMHGSMMVDGHIGMLLWAPDLHLGLVSVTRDFSTGDVTYARVTSVAAEGRTQ